VILSPLILSIGIVFVVFDSLDLVFDFGMIVLDFLFLKRED